MGMAFAVGGLLGDVFLHIVPHEMGGHDHGSHGHGSHDHGSHDHDHDHDHGALPPTASVAADVAETTTPCL